jgi:hypothetical protein
MGIQLFMHYQSSNDYLDLSVTGFRSLERKLLLYLFSLVFFVFKIFLNAFKSLVVIVYLPLPLVYYFQSFVIYRHFCRYQYDLNAPGAASQLRLISTRDLNLNVSVSNANMIIQAYASWNNLINVQKYQKKRVSLLYLLSLFVFSFTTFFLFFIYSIYISVSAEIPTFLFFPNSPDMYITSNRMHFLQLLMGHLSLTSITGEIII